MGVSGADRERASREEVLSADYRRALTDDGVWGRVSAAGLDEGRVGVAAQVLFVVGRTRSSVSKLSREWLRLGLHVCGAMLLSLEARQLGRETPRRARHKVFRQKE